MNAIFKSVIARSCGTAMVLVLMESQAAAAPRVAAGGDVSTVVAAGDFLWAAGRGGYQADYSPPAALKRDHAWAVIDCADNGGLGIDGSGALWAWGSQSIISGATGSSSSSFYPIKIGTDLWRSVSAQGEYCFGIKEDGTLWGCGNFNVQNVGVFYSNVPVQFGSAGNWRFVTGGDYSLAIQDDGSLWAWGHNGHGNLGDGTYVGRTAPVRIGTDSDWKSAACVEWTSYGIKTDGSLWAWGSGIYGDGSAFGISKVPVRVGTDNNWLKISGGSSAVLAIRTDGSLWSWGQSSNGMLGLGTVTTQLVPARIGQENSWADLATGYSHVIAARNDGSIWAWGSNNIQQFGIAGISGSDVPIDVTNGFFPRPRFLIYRDGYSIEQNSYYWTLKTAILQEPTVFDIKVRNNGFAPLSLSPGQLPGITILPPGAVPGLSDATLQVRLDATGAGPFSGQVAVNSNDSDRPLFTLDLNGHVVSPANDSDGDGMKDGAEVALGALGFLWNSHQPALVKTFYENVGLAGFHGEREIMDVQWRSGTPLMEASGNTIWMSFELNLPGGSSTPLLLPENIRQTSCHALDVSVPLPVGKRFVRMMRP